MLVSHGVAQSDLGVEIAPLGIQYVDIVDTAGTVLQVGQPNILAGCVAQSAFQGGRFADMSVGGDRVGRLAEDLEHFLFVLQTRLVVSCHGGAVFRLLAAESENGGGEIARHIRERRTEKVLQSIILPSSRQRNGKQGETVGIGYADSGHGCP